MKGGICLYQSKKILLAILLAAAAAIVWLAAVTAGSRNSARQDELFQEAQTYIDDQIYVRAVPLLEEAAEIQTGRTGEVQRALADCYRALGEEKTYLATLLTMLNADTADADLYRETADHYFLNHKYQSGLDTLKEGIARLDSEELTDYYESVRYAFTKSYAKYEDIRSMSDGFAAVCLEGKWGYLDADGDLTIPCVFDQAMDFENGSAAVIENGQVIVIDTDGFRTALCKEAADSIAPFGQGVTSLRINGKWRLANAEMRIGATEYDFIGTLSDGGRAVCRNGKWVLQNSSSEDQTDEFDGFSLDEKGCAYRNGRAFAKSGELTYLVDATGTRISETGYTDAYPFLESDGLAAVCKDGKWGFLDKNGQEVLPFEWDSACSFSEGVAAVEKDGLWGYISLRGEIAVPLQYIGAKPFSERAAAVQTESGWSLIRFQANP